MSYLGEVPKTEGVEKDSVHRQVLLRYVVARSPKGDEAISSKQKYACYEEIASGFALATTLSFRNEIHIRRL